MWLAESQAASETPAVYLSALEADLSSTPTFGSQHLGTTTSSTSTRDRCQSTL